MRKMIRKSMMRERDWEWFSEDSHLESINIFETKASKKLKEIVGFFQLPKRTNQRQKIGKVSIERNKNENIIHIPKWMRKFIYTEEFFFQIVHISITKQRRKWPSNSQAFNLATKNTTENKDYLPNHGQTRSVAAYSKPYLSRNHELSDSIRRLIRRQLVSQFWSLDKWRGYHFAKVPPVILLTGNSEDIAPTTYFTCTRCP